MKFCTGCNEDKDLSLFGRDESKKDGLAYKCRACLSEYQRRRREGASLTRPKDWKKKTQDMAAYQKAWRNANKGYMNKKKAEWYKKNPERSKVKDAVRYALKTGKLIKLPCFICGEMNVQGHHPDYSRPLDVVWLCKEHHMEIHYPI